MKSTFLISIALLFSLGLCSSGCNNEDSDDKLGKFVTEDAIMNELKKGHEGISKDDICIDEIKGFKTFFIAGFFAHDRGCGDSQYFYKGNSIELTNENIQTILTDNGFKENANKTVELYHSDVINHLNYVLTQMPERFDSLTFDFHAPKTWEEDGQIYSHIWVQRPGGMMPEDRFYLSEFVVNLKGLKISHAKKNQFTVPYK
jgi:hypothetical protein